MAERKIWMRAQDAIDYYGSGAKLAEMLGITPSAVSQFKAAGYLPEHHAWHLRHITDDGIPVSFHEPIKDAV